MPCRNRRAATARGEGHRAAATVWAAGARSPRRQTPFIVGLGNRNVQRLQSSRRPSALVSANVKSTPIGGHQDLEIFMSERSSMMMMVTDADSQPMIVDRAIVRRLNG